MKINYSDCITSDRRKGLSLKLVLFTLVFLLMFLSGHVDMTSYADLEIFPSKTCGLVLFFRVRGREFCVMSFSRMQHKTCVSQASRGLFPDVLRSIRLKDPLER